MTQRESTVHIGDRRDWRGASQGVGNNNKRAEVESVESTEPSGDDLEGGRSVLAESTRSNSVQGTSNKKADNKYRRDPW